MSGLNCLGTPVPVIAPYFRDPREARHHVVATRNFDGSAPLRRVALAMCNSHKTCLRGRNCYGTRNAAQAGAGRGAPQCASADSRAYQSYSPLAILIGTSRSGLLGVEIDPLEQVISLSEWTTFDVEPILPVMPWPTGSLVRATTGIGRFLRGG